MAKPRHEGKLTKITTPTPYGSHSSMIKSQINDTLFLLSDDLGDYETTKDRIDSGMADPNRWDYGKRGL
jgi:hypothetical protein